MIINAHPDNVNEDEVIDAIKEGDYLIKGGEVENGVLLMVHLFWQDVQVWLCAGMVDAQGIWRYFKR